MASRWRYNLFRRCGLTFSVDRSLTSKGQPEMSSLEAYLERADELAQDVINVWKVSAPNFLGPEFRILLHKAFLYETAKEVAERHRAFDILRKRDEVEERAARMAFARAYKIYSDRRAARLN